MRHSSGGLHQKDHLENRLKCIGRHYIHAMHFECMCTWSASKCKYKYKYIENTNTICTYFECVPGLQSKWNRRSGAGRTPG